MGDGHLETTHSVLSAYPYPSEQLGRVSIFRFITCRLYIEVDLGFWAGVTLFTKMELIFQPTYGEAFTDTFLGYAQRLSSGTLVSGYICYIG